MPAIPEESPPEPSQFFVGHDRLTTTEIYLNLSSEDTIREFFK